MNLHVHAKNTLYSVGCTNASYCQHTQYNRCCLLTATTLPNYCQIAACWLQCNRSAAILLPNCHLLAAMQHSSILIGFDLQYNLLRSMDWIAVQCRVQDSIYSAFYLWIYNILWYSRCGSKINHSTNVILFAMKFDLSTKLVLYLSSTLCKNRIFLISLKGQNISLPALRFIFLGFN